MKEMVGGCCVCSDDRGWPENPLVYCDGQGCTVAVHQACYGIVTVPQGNWYCRKCEAQERAVKVRCELCPSRDGALKPTDNNGWAHVVCALYIPEVRFGNVTTMEPIILHQIPQERFTKSCYICEESSKGSRATVGACMQCNKVGCRQQFHVTCAQSLGLLCEEAGNYLDNVKYCGYCHHHYTKLKKGGNVKPIPPYRPVSTDSPDASPGKDHNDTSKTTSKRKLRGGKTPPSTTVAIAPVAGTSPPEPSSSPRPLTPGMKLSVSLASASSMPGPQLVPLQSQQQPSLPPPAAPPPAGVIPNPSPPGGVVKPGSIVVQVPLEAAMPSGGGGVAPPPPLPSTSPPSVDLPDLPAKRARSQSSEKSEKGRRSKRTSGGSGAPTNSGSGGGSGGSSSKGGSSSASGSATTSSSGSAPPSAVVHPTTHQHQHSSSSSVNSVSGSVTIKGVVNSNSSSGGGDEHLSSHKSRKTVVKEEKDMKIFQNGVSAPHMLGNQLNPSSTMAQKMCDTLSQEVAAHSIFSTEPNLSTSTNLIGPHLPKSSSARSSASGNAPTGGSNGSVSWNSSIPQSLDQLLERQWEQGSQFLMEQAQHFDIASLLSCLHQLRAENAQLEEHVNSLLARRDHLLAVNARLAIPLVQVQSTASVQQQASRPGSGQQQAQPPQQAQQQPQPPVVVENGVASPAEQQPYHPRNSASVRSQQSHTSGGAASNGCFVVGGGGGSGVANSQVPPQPVVQSTVVVRASSSTASATPVASAGPVAPTSQLAADPHRRVGSSGAYSNTIYSSNQPSTSQQSQVVMRRPGESQQQMSSNSGSGGDQQPQPPGHVQIQPQPPSSNTC